MHSEMLAAGWPLELPTEGLDHGPRSNDSVFGGLEEAAQVDLSPRLAEQRLPFRLGVVTHEAQLLRVQALRQAAYGRHLPAMAASFGSADPLDRLSDTTIFYVEDKASGAMVGSARVQTNRHAPLQIERSIELPGPRQGQLLCEITRLCVMPGYAQPVRLALLKATHLFCIAMQIRGVLAGSRPSLLRTYLTLGFTDLMGDDRLVPLKHAGDIPHRILFRDAVRSEAITRERHHPDYDFVFNAYHPDIEIFEAVAASVTRGLRGVAPAAWPRAA
jgi:hypothetical protein